MKKKTILAMLLLFFLLGTSVTKFCTDTYDGAGDFAFINPANAEVEDGSYTQSIGVVGGLQANLGADHFGFAIPGGATLDSIYVQIKHLSTVSLSDIYLQEIRLNDFNGSFGDFFPVSVLPTTLTWQSFGFAISDFSTAPTVSDVNATTWGFGLIYENDDALAATIDVDAVKMTIVYHTASGTKRYQVR